MQIEKEVRYKVEDQSWQRALEISSDYKAKSEMLDITMGSFGFDSVATTGKVFRIRSKANKTTLEIKSKIADGWAEEAIVIDNLKQGINFLTLAGLTPYLFIDRVREVRKFKNLLIFFDDIKLLGKYIEIEYQDSNNAYKEVKEFLALSGIEGEPQKLYGDIIKDKLVLDDTFRQEFETTLNTIINE